MKVREEAAPRLPVTEVAWHPPRLLLLCAGEGRGAAGGKS